MITKTGEMQILTSSQACVVDCTTQACLCVMLIVHSNLGEMYSWGNGSNGRLGHADEETQLVPRVVAGVTRAVAVCNT